MEFAMRVAKAACLSSFQGNPRGELAYRLRGYQRALARAKAQNSLAKVTAIDDLDENNENDENDENDEVEDDED